MIKKESKITEVQRHFRKQLLTKIHMNKAFKEIVDLTFANSEFYYLNDEEANAIKQSYKRTDQKTIKNKTSHQKKTKRNKNNICNYNLKAIKRLFW